MRRARWPSFPQALSWNAVPPHLQVVQLDEDRGEFVSRGYVDHPYPATKCQWAPQSLAASRDLLATTGDYLRLWVVHGDHDIRAECTLNNAKSSDYCAPITSFDWNTDDPSLIATSSIDTTCTVWDINVKKVRGTRARPLRSPHARAC